ncbi:helix-turn-helix domain-containing protein [bacterium]|nr:helix-turn-helix domain-containing protein [bacterium]
MRRRRHLTQIEMAQELQISQSCISKMERGLLIPSVLQWAVFCSFVRIPMDCLMLSNKARD